MVGRSCRWNREAHREQGIHHRARQTRPGSYSQRGRGEAAPSGTGVLRAHPAVEYGSIQRPAVELSKASSMPDWEQHGIRIVRAGELDTNTPQTAGMTRAAAITHARAGAQKLWA